MNLKEWQAMTPEEQQAYWEKASQEERQRLKEMEDKVTYLSWELDNEPTFQPKSNHCCHIRDIFIKQLKDEEEGVVFYSNMAGELGIIGEDGLSEVVSHIADVEFDHYLKLRGIIDILTENCNCERKHVGPPFGG